VSAIVARLDVARPSAQPIAAPMLPPLSPSAALHASAPRLRPDPSARAGSAASATSTSATQQPLDASLSLSVARTITHDAPAEAAPKPDPRAAAAAPANADAPRTDATAQPATAAAPAPLPPAAPRLLPAAYQPVGNPINMGQFAFEMVRQVHQGLSRFAIRLDPPELGRVDVRMHVDPSGGVTARLTVDRSETLDLFQRDQRTLERALQQAGLDSQRTTLEFSLRQNHNPFAGMAGGDQRRPDIPMAPARFASGGDDDIASLAAITTLYRGTASAGGVNLFV
jgi:flagellar hook-length control protein FliK